MAQNQISNRLLMSVLALATLETVGCSGSFQGAAGTGVSSLSSTTPGSTSPTGGPGSGTTAPAVPTNAVPTTPAQNLQNLGVIGLLSGAALGLGNIQVLSLDTVNKDLLLTLPIPLGGTLNGVGVTAPLTQPPGATLGVQTLAGGASGLILSIPLADIVKGGLNLPSPTTLPNGMPIPAVPNGELPALAVTVPTLKGVNATIYLDTNVVGIFIAAPSTLSLEITVPIKSPDGSQTWGYLSSIPAVGKLSGGYFISIQLPAAIALAIDNNI